MSAALYVSYHYLSEGLPALRPLCFLLAFFLWSRCIGIDILCVSPALCQHQLQILWPFGQWWNKPWLVQAPLWAHAQKNPEGKVCVAESGNYTYKISHLLQWWNIWSTRLEIFPGLFHSSVIGFCPGLDQWNVRESDIYNFWDMILKE